MRHLDLLRFVDTVARAGSIRKAAETLAITSTALNRRILALEDDLGVELFERLPRGVRLSTAGELYILCARSHLADMDRLRSQIADLAGERRGHVSIASTRAALPVFLPQEVAAYRRDHPAVSFDIRQRSRAEAEQELIDYAADLALVFEPVQHSEFQMLISAPQPIVAIMPKDHELANRTVVRLAACSQYPVALPSRTAGVRAIIDLALTRGPLKLRIAVESEDSHFLINLAREEGLITFDVPLGLSDEALDRMGVIALPLDPRDVPDGRLYLGQLRGRILPVAAARFADQLVRRLSG